MESGFVLNTVCRRLMKEMPEVPVFTIHDSVLTTPSHADDVLRIFRQEFRSVGLSPRFHVTDYGNRVAGQSEGLVATELPTEAVHEAEGENDVAGTE